MVTGSRDWKDVGLIHRELYNAWKDLVYEDEDVLLVHGCARGADSIAAETWLCQGFPVEEHPADWVQHGKRAGFVRNTEMVSLGADLCLAFIRNGSAGATMFAALAQGAGIPVRRFEVSDEHGKAP